MEKNETIVLGGGCFWCTEAVFLMIDGVVETKVGYAGGSEPSPTYEEVSTGYTGHAEVMKLVYDPKKLPISKIMDVFFKMHDPTSLNKQGADTGTQYRSAIFYTDNEQKEEVIAYIKEAQKEYTKPIVTEVKRLDKFYAAEDYHQHYFEKNPFAGYCQFVVKPKVEKIKKEFLSN